MKIQNDETKLAEIQSCAIQNLATTPTNENTNKGLVSRIIGVGNTIANSKLTLILLLILILLALYYLLKQKYQNRGQNKTKKKNVKLVSLFSWFHFNLA